VVRAVRRCPESSLSRREGGARKCAHWIASPPRVEVGPQAGPSRSFFSRRDASEAAGPGIRDACQSNPSFLAAVDAAGVRFRHALGSASPTALAIDENEDAIWATGGFNPTFTYRGHTLETTGGAGAYLLRVDENGDAIEVEAITHDGFLWTSISSLVVDNEGQLVIAGYDSTNAPGVILLRLRP
jgi:hypothetical protein